MFLSIGGERDLLGLLLAGSTGGAVATLRSAATGVSRTPPRERTSRCESRVLSGLRLSDPPRPVHRAPPPSNEQPGCTVISLQKGGSRIHLPG